jgi:hypothetical protein
MKNYNLGNIEIMGKDLSYRDNKINMHPTIKGIDVFTYDTAINLAKQYGDDWRLPTINEFKFLQEYYNINILRFSAEAYWAFDNILEGFSNNYAYYLSTRRYGGIPKDQRLKVRLVRNI